MEKRKYTSIQLTKETKKRLMKLGRMGDTYESIILKLLDAYNKQDDKKGNK